MELKTELEKTEKQIKKEISSDFKLFYSISLEIIKYILLFPVNFLLFLLNLFLLNSAKRNEYFQKLIILPFSILSKFFKWFFEAKYTAYLIIFLIISFIFEIYLLNNLSDLTFFKSLKYSPLHIFEGNYYSIFTSVFLHANLTHLFSNIIALLIFGRRVEKIFKEKVLFIFLSSAVIANLISGLIYYYLKDFTPSLGASGGIAGLIIFAILLEPFSLTSLLLVPLPIFIIGWALIILDLIGLSNPSKTNNLAHLAGYLSLLILFFFIEFRKRKKIILGLTINIFMIFLLYLIFKYFNLSFTFI